MNPCVLYENADSSVVVYDIPRSLELAQAPPGDTPPRIVSGLPLQHPYPSLEPKSSKAIANVRDASLDELLLDKHLQLALDETRASYQGPWCGPRVLLSDHADDEERPRKSSKVDATHTSRADDASYDVRPAAADTPAVFIPPNARYILGNLEETMAEFDQISSKFHLILMDPPWPNRSVRRASAYETVYDMPSARRLLRSLPIAQHVAADGYVGVWITNKAAVRDLVLADDGLFAAWDLAPVAEYVWLKVTARGEPVSPIDGRWRKPYEVLLVGRPQAAVPDAPVPVTRRVLIAVPDVHSRKPHLAAIFAPCLPPQYTAMEIFARHLTAGWWAWGNEVLKFQGAEWWQTDGQPATTP